MGYGSALGLNLTDGSFSDVGGKDRVDLESIPS